MTLLSCWHDRSVIATAVGGFLQQRETVTYGVEAAGALIASVLCLRSYRYLLDCDLPNMQDARDMDSGHELLG